MAYLKSHIGLCILGMVIASRSAGGSGAGLEKQGEASPSEHTGWLGCTFTGSRVDKLHASCFLALDNPYKYG